VDIAERPQRHAATGVEAVEQPLAFAVVGEAPVMEAQLITHAGEGVLQSVNLFETCIAPLRNAQQPARFTF